MREYIEEKLSELTQELKKYEIKSYSIYDVGGFINDRVAYDRILGEYRTYKMMLALLERNEEV